MERTLLLFPHWISLGFLLSNLCCPDVTNHDVYLAFRSSISFKLYSPLQICVFLALDLCVVLRAFVIPSRKIGKDNRTVPKCVILDPHHVPALNESREFNELVNMTAGELEWLKEEQSATSGCDKGDGSSETIGHET